jgi:hypothetical protein
MVLALVAFLPVPADETGQFDETSNQQDKYKNTINTTLWSLINGSYLHEVSDSKDGIF